jgi:hypothetical protein
MSDIVLSTGHTEGTDRVRSTNQAIRPLDVVRASSRQEDSHPHRPERINTLRESFEAEDQAIPEHKRKLRSTLDKAVNILTSHFRSIEHPPDKDLETLRDFDIEGFLQMHNVKIVSREDFNSVSDSALKGRETPGLSIISRPSRNKAENKLEEYLSSKRQEKETTQGIKERAEYLNKLLNTIKKYETEINTLSGNYTEAAPIQGQNQDIRISSKSLRPVDIEDKVRKTGYHRGSLSSAYSESLNINHHPDVFSTPLLERANHYKTLYHKYKERSGREQSIAGPSQRRSPRGRIPTAVTSEAPYDAEVANRRVTLI